MTNTENTVQAAVRFLAGHCDGARRNDGAGFSAYDADFGHSMAKAAAEGRYFTIGMLKACKKLAHKYRKQLVAGGFDMEAIANQPDPGPRPERVELPPVCFPGMVRKTTEKGGLIAFVPADGNGPKDTVEEWFPRAHVKMEMTGQGGAGNFTVPGWMTKGHSPLPALDAATDEAPAPVRMTVRESMRGIDLG